MLSQEILSSIELHAHLRKENPEADFKPSAVRNIRLIKLQWKERQEQCRAESLTQKGEQPLRVENRKINILE